MGFWESGGEWAGESNGLWVVKNSIESSVGDRMEFVFERFVGWFSGL